jgi:predicted SAM-dependent methyltransferase
MIIANFGCGADPAPHCLNIDGSLTVILARLPVPARLFGSRMGFVTAVRDCHVKFGTARRLRFADASLDAFYTSHTLEHLSRAGCEDVVGRVRQWLKPGGVLRVVLPDLRQMAADYLSGKLDADEFVLNTRLVRPQSHGLRLPLDHAEHLWMYDSDSFIALLQRFEYRDIQVSSFRSSRLTELAKLDVAAREYGSFYVEAIR